MEKDSKLLEDNDVTKDSLNSASMLHMKDVIENNKCSNILILLYSLTIIYTALIIFSFNKVVSYLYTWIANVTRSNVYYDAALNLFKYKNIMYSLMVIAMLASPIALYLMLKKSFIKTILNMFKDSYWILLGIAILGEYNLYMWCNYGTFIITNFTILSFIFTGIILALMYKGSLWFVEYMFPYVGFSMAEYAKANAFISYVSILYISS